MTIEKAIYQLEDLIKDRESFVDNDYDPDNVFRQDIEACKAGIQALEKQIPKKVIWKYAFYWACCPNCKNNIYDEEKEKFKFCPDCGQALEWSEENEV